MLFIRDDAESPKVKKKKQIYSKVMKKFGFKTCKLQHVNKNAMA